MFLVGYFRNQEVIVKFGNRLRKLRVAAGLTQERVYFGTGISQSQVANTESGRLNTSLSHVALYAEFYGLQSHEILNFDQEIPDRETLKESISLFIINRGISPELYFKETPGITFLLENILSKSNFLEKERYAIELVEYCKREFNANYSTTQVSKAMDGLTKRGLVKKVESEVKTKLQYIAN